MVAPNLVAVVRPRRARRRRLGELRRDWLLAYTATWILTLAPAALLAISPECLDGLVRSVLGATLKAQDNPPPSIGHVLILLAHNLPLAAWPLLLGRLEVDRDRLARQITDSLAATCFTINILSVGAALGVYGSALLPFIPQVPFEWAALALGASTWLAQRREPLAGKEKVALLAAIAASLACGAVLETLAVPYR